MPCTQRSLFTAVVVFTCLLSLGSSDSPLGTLNGVGRVPVDIGGIVPVMPPEPLTDATPAPQTPISIINTSTPDTRCSDRADITCKLSDGRVLRFDSAVPNRTLVTDDIRTGKWYDLNPPSVRTIYIYVNVTKEKSAGGESGSDVFNETAPTVLTLRRLSERLRRKHEEVQQHLHEQIKKSGIDNVTNHEVDDLILKLASKYHLPKDLLKFPDSLLGYDPADLRSQLRTVALSVRKMDKLNDMLTALKREHKKSMVAIQLQKSDQELNRLDAILGENEKFQHLLLNKTQTARKRHESLVAQLKRLNDETPITKRQLEDLKHGYKAVLKGFKRGKRMEHHIHHEYLKLLHELKEYSALAIKAFGSAHHEIEFGLDESSTLQQMSESATKLLVNLDERTRVLRDRIIDLVPSARQDLLTPSEQEMEVIANAKAKGQPISTSISAMKKRINQLEMALVAAKLDNNDLILKQSRKPSQLPLAERPAPPISDREHPKLTVNASAANAYPEFKHSLRTQLLNYVDTEIPPPRQKPQKLPLGQKLDIPLTKERN